MVCLLRSPPARRRAYVGSGVMIPPPLWDSKVFSYTMSRSSRGRRKSGKGMLTGDILVWCKGRSWDLEYMLLTDKPWNPMTRVSPTCLQSYHRAVMRRTVMSRKQRIRWCFNTRDIPPAYCYMTEVHAMETGEDWMSIRWRNSYKCGRRMTKLTYGFKFRDCTRIALNPALFEGNPHWYEYLRPKELKPPRNQWSKCGPKWSFHRLSVMLTRWATQHPLVSVNNVISSIHAIFTYTLTNNARIYTRQVAPALDLLLLTRKSLTPERKWWMGTAQEILSGL